MITAIMTTAPTAAPIITPILLDDWVVVSSVDCWTILSS